MAWTRNSCPCPAGRATARRAVSRTKRQVARSKTCFLGIDGLNDQSNSSSGFSSRNCGRFHATVDQPLVAHQQFVLQDEFQELGMAELMAGGLLQTHVQGFGQPREAKLSQRTLQAIIHGLSPGGTRKGELRWNCPAKRSRLC